MKKITLFSVLFLAICTSIYAQKKYSMYAVGFYNQENLFDTCHDVGKNDYDFLPSGSYRWNKMKYENKLQNMARVLSEMGTDRLPNIGCAMIGLSEVENANVLSDLVAQAPLKSRGYKFVHVEGPDKRGIDCALLYNPELFKIDSVRLHQFYQEIESDSDYFTRGFLTVSGRLADEHVVVIVNHLPSRFSGSFYRELGAKQIYKIKENLMKEDPDAKIIVMGDMNDDPMNKSMAVELRGKAEVNDVKEGDMYNPWWNVLSKEGKGTLSYQGSWNLFDQILFSHNMINREGEKDFSTLKYYQCQVFRRDYLINTEGRYKGMPKRTTAGGVWLNGYSDHIPVVAYLLKEQKN